MTKLENNLIETRSDMSQEAYEQHDHHESKEAEQASSSVITNTVNMHGKIKKSVNFEASKEASMDLERIISERYTPETDLFDYPPDLFDDTALKPDLKLICKSCKIHIDLSELNEHRQYHEALSFLGLKLLPENEEALKEKRAYLLKTCQSKYLKRSNDFVTSKAIDWNSRVKRINNAYELIKSYMNNTFEATRRVGDNNYKLDAFGESRVSSNELIVGIGSCSNQNKNHQRFMQDRNVVMEVFGENKSLTYLGTFDGYDGEVASAKCSLQLHLALLYQLSRMNVGVEYLKEKFIYDEVNYLNKYDESGEDKEPAVADRTLSRTERFQSTFGYAYRQMDKLLARGRDETSQKRWSGATSCVCVIENRDGEGWIHMSNCGDVEAIVILDTSNDPKGKRFKVLTCKHTFNTFEKDFERAKRKGAKIFEVAGVKKLLGLYSVSRALGFHGDRNVKSFIKSEPAIESFKVEENFVCMIVATKGLWNCLSHEQVTDLVHEILPSDTKQLLNRNGGTVVSPSVKAILSQYYKNQNASNSKFTKSSLVIKSSSKVEDACGEVGKISKGDVKASRKNSIISIESKSTEVFDEPLSNYVRPDKGSQFYSANRSRTAPLDSELSIAVGDYKTNSDIYPVIEKNQLMNQSHDQYHEMKELKAFEREYQKPIWQSKSSFEIEHNFDEQYGLINEPYAAKHDIELTETSFKATQVTENELALNARQLMENSKQAKRLEISEMLAEKLVSCALIAGSTDNITVNCVLFPGCKY